MVTSYVMERIKTTEGATKDERKKYQCGWCKFRAVFSATILRHHERKHPGLELDIVIVKRPGRPFTSPPKESGDAVSSGSRVCFHSNTWHDDLDLGRSSHIGPSEEENNSTHLNSYSKRQRTIKTDLADSIHRRKHKIKPLYVKCFDILKCGAWYIRTLTDKYALSKVCLDAVLEKDFIRFTTNFKHQVQFIHTRKPNSEPRDIEKLQRFEIANLIRGKE